MNLSDEQLSELRTVIKTGTYDGSVSARAQIVLWHHEGRRKTDIAEMSSASRPTIDKRISRYAIYGIDGLASETSPGGRRTIPGRIRGRVLALTRQTPPEELGISHWTAGKMAAYIKKTLWGARSLLAPVTCADRRLTVIRNDDQPCLSVCST